MLRPIIFFGASFNPPTKAHLALVEYIIKTMKVRVPKPIILLAPVYQHIFSKPGLVDFDPRLKLTALQFKQAIESGDVIVSDIEARVYNASGSEAPCGTVDTLAYIKAHPDEFPGCNVNDISLMLGGDTYHDLIDGKWKDTEKLIDQCHHIHVFERNHASLRGTSNPKFIFHNNAITDPLVQSISSTRIRQNLEKGQAGLVPDVLDEIRRKYSDLFG